MNNLKLLALLLISFIATGSIVYQLRTRRPGRGAVVMPAPGGGIPSSAPADDSKAESVPLEKGDSAQSAQGGSAPTAIPSQGWGRNPFLTVDEIKALNAPVPVVISPSPAPTVEPTTGLPVYQVTAILVGPQRKWAVIGSRVVQTGDQLGVEIVKEIKNESVVLEFEGRTRELPLRKFGESVRRSAPPKGERL